MAKKRSKGKRKKRAAEPKAPSRNAKEDFAPSKTSTLRFVAGDDVFFHCLNTGWQAGTVLETHYRQAKWPDSRPCCAYRVEQKSLPLESGKKPSLVEIESDTDDHIRVMPNARFPKNVISRLSVDPPEPEDPLSHLYRDDEPKNEALQSLEALRKWSGGEQVTRYKTNRDGSVAVCKTRDLGSPIGKLGIWKPNGFVLPKNLSLDSPLIHGVSPYLLVSYILPRVQLRSPWQQPIESAEEALKALLPDQSSVKELERVAQSSAPAERERLLLKLGDAFAFGLKGWERDIFRACHFYQACGGGLPMKETAEKAIPVHAVGLPEGLAALAVQSHYQAEMFAHAWMNGLSSPQGGAGCERPMLELENIFLASRSETFVQQFLKSTMMNMVAALRFGWASILTIQYGRYFDTTGQSYSWMKSCKKKIETIRQAFINQQLTLQVQEEMRNVGKTCPSAGTLSRFGSKSMKILRGIQLNEDLTASELHIRFLEIPTLSKPVCVAMMIPNASVFVDSFVLPEGLQLFPFSDEAFKWVWNRMAFSIHLGIGRSTELSKKRVRPSHFTLLDIPGDRDYAMFLKMKLRSMPDTTVSIMNENEEHLSNLDGDFENIKKRHISEQEMKPTSTSSGPFWRSVTTGSGMTSAFQSFRSGSAQLSDSKKAKDDAETLQQLGDAYHDQKNFRAARRLYTRGIASLRSSIRQPSSDVLQLMALLLSKLAASSLDMARTAVHYSGTALLNEAMTSCDLVLSSDLLSSAVSYKLLDKVKFQRDLAESRLPIDFRLCYEQDHLVSEDTVVHFDMTFKTKLYGQISDPEKPTVVRTGTEMLDITDDENEECPICKSSFAVDLFNQHILHFGCNHFFCVPCVMDSRKSEDKGYSCALCRREFGEDIVGLLVDHLVTSNDLLRKAIDDLPVGTTDERKFILREVLRNQRFDADATLKYIDDMMCSSALGIMWQLDALTHEQKVEIYEEAQRPVKLIEEQIQSLIKQREVIIDQEASMVYCELGREIQDLSIMRHSAAINARDEIYHRMNSAGTMGVLNSEINGITLDFHGLKVKEAKEKFDSEVMPVLPVLKTMALVTGRGHHSKNGASTLKPALKRHVSQKHSFCVTVAESTENQGILLVQYANAKDTAYE